MPDDPVPTGWMSRSNEHATAFLRNHEERMRSFMHAATSMQLGRVILPYHYDVLSVAADFLAAGKPDVAVIMAQTACEIALDVIHHFESVLARVTAERRI